MFRFFENLIQKWVVQARPSIVIQNMNIMTLIVARFCAFLLKWINIGFNCLITKLQSVQTLHAIVRKVSLTSVFLTFFV